MDQPSSETFYGYCMSEDGTYGEPVQLHSAKEVGDFLLDNVQKHHELRVTDRDDALVLHVKDQRLLHPLAAGESPNNRWDAKLLRFVAQH